VYLSSPNTQHDQKTSFLPLWSVSNYDKSLYGQIYQPKVYDQDLVADSMQVLQDKQHEISHLDKDAEQTSSSIIASLGMSF